jgi:hypothetical protein
MNERRAAIERICGDFGAAILYAFGSRAVEVRDWLDGRLSRLSPGASDVDIGARGHPDKPWSVIEKVRLALALEDLFDCSRVDLVSLSEADPFLAAEIIRGERLFARDEHEADEYDLYVLRRAGDLAPLESERQALVLGEDR